MTPRRVLQVKQGEWAAGGVEAFLMSMLRNVDRDLVQFDVLTIVDRFTPGPHDAELQALGGQRHVCIERGRGPGLGKIVPLRALHQLVREHRYEIVHIHTGSPFHGLYAYAARLAGARTVVLHSHTAEGPAISAPLRKFLDIALRPAPTHRFACSGAAGRWLFPASVQSTVRVLHNGIDLDSFRFDPETRARMRSQLGIADGQVVVGHVGRFSHEKNHPRLLRAFHAFLTGSSAAPAPMLLCVGDGEDRPAAERLMDELGISGQVRFLGVRSDVGALMQAMDVFVLPSRKEGLGIGGVEAQAAGLPCVFSTGVPEEADVTGRCSFLPVSASPSAWAAAIDRAAGIPRVDTVESVRAAGYDAKRCAAELQDFYLRAP